MFEIGDKVTVNNQTFNNQAGEIAYRVGHLYAVKLNNRDTILICNLEEISKG